MTKQHSNHFVCCFQKIAFVQIQLWYLDARRCPTCGRYLTFVPGSGTFRRNRRHLRATGESFPFQSHEVPDNVPVADPYAANHEKRSASSAPYPMKVLFVLLRSCPSLYL